MTSEFDAVKGLVSVIIPTKNSSKTIAKCLQSIKNQTYSNVEILIVDALSSDGTKEISLQHGAQVITLDGERTKAKNYGTLKSRGEFVFFVDSDMVLEPNVVKECVEAFSYNGAAGVIIPERSIGPGFWIKVRDFERGLYRNSKIESARFFLKKYVVEARGFDEDVIFFEESTLPQKLELLGLRVDFRITSSIFHIEDGFQMIKWLRKKRYYYRTAKEYACKYEKYADSQLSVLYRVRTFTSHGKWKTVVRHPVLAIGLIVLKTLELFVSKI